MRVSITHGEKKTGLIMKKTFYTVLVQVEFSQEELAVIKQRKLEKTIVMERPWPAHMGEMSGNYNLSIGSLVSNLTTETNFTTPVEAKQYEAELTNKLRALKEFLTDNTSTGTSTSFEL